MFVLNYMCVVFFCVMDEMNEDLIYMKMWKGFSIFIVDVFENFYKVDGTMVMK